MKAASQAVKKVTALAPTKKTAPCLMRIAAQRKELPRAINELLWLPRTKQHLD